MKSAPPLIKAATPATMKPLRKASIGHGRESPIPSSDMKTRAMGTKLTTTPTTHQANHFEATIPCLRNTRYWMIPAALQLPTVPMIGSTGPRNAPHDLRRQERPNDCDHYETKSGGRREDPGNDP